MCYLACNTKPYREYVIIKNIRQNQCIFWEFYEQGGKQAVRLDQWKGIRLNIKEHPDNPIELYNLVEDPEELNDISADHPDLVNKIELIMLEAHTPSEVFSYR